VVDKLAEELAPNDWYFNVVLRVLCNVLVFNVQLQQRHWEAQTLDQLSVHQFDEQTKVGILSSSQYVLVLLGSWSVLGRIGVETDIVQSQCDPVSDPVMLQDQLDIAFICGLPFIQISSSPVN